MPFKILLTALMSTLVFSNTAYALSCMRPDLMKTMEEAKASQTVYSVWVGTFDTLASAQVHSDFIAPRDQFKPRPPKLTSAQFTGYALTPNARTDVPLSLYPVDIETRCSGPWCGKVPSAEYESLVFVEMRPQQTPILKIMPCPQWVFSVKAETEAVERIRACFDKPCRSLPQDSHYR